MRSYSLQWHYTDKERNNERTGILPVAAPNERIDNIQWTSKVHNAIKKIIKIYVYAD